MVTEKTPHWWTAVLLLILVIGAAGCGARSEKRSEMTPEQQKALARAQTYLFHAGFSKKVLIEQLRADGAYSNADATFAANNAEVNWNQEALEAAAVYLEEQGPFSKDALIRRLTRVEQFTPAQARYAVNRLYGSVGTASETTSQESQSAKPAAEMKPATTSEQKEALAKAQRYIDGGGFSKRRVIDYLRWSEDTGYSKADATVAANNLGANWNREAFQMASDYLKDLGPLSKDTLLRRLTLVYLFTPAQARYAVNKLY